MHGRGVVCRLNAIHLPVYTVCFHDPAINVRFIPRSVDREPKHNLSSQACKTFGADKRAIKVCFQRSLLCTIEDFLRPRGFHSPFRVKTHSTIQLAQTLGDFGRSGVSSTRYTSFSPLTLPSRACCIPSNTPTRPFLPSLIG